MKYYLQISTAFLLFLLRSSSCFAQQTTLSSGGEALGTEGSISYSLGEMLYEGLVNNTANIQAGIQQPIDIPIGGIRLAIKVFLAGPFDVELGLMHDSLRTNNLLPLTEPYSSYPFLKPQIGLPGGEAVPITVLSQSGPDAVVDWVFIELRSSSNSSQIVATKRALLQRDGDVVSAADGLSPIIMTGFPPDQYFVSVKHRNHLGVMTATALPFTMDSQYIDFTSTSLVWVNNLIQQPPQKQIGNKYALWPGDANYNKNTKYNGLQNDKEFVLGALGGSAYLNNIITGYRSEDLNMDHKIKYNGLDNDRSVIANQVGVNTPNKIIGQHTPN
jgi:hypothetical protein